MFLKKSTVRIIFTGPELSPTKIIYARSVLAIGGMRLWEKKNLQDNCNCIGKNEEVGGSVSFLNS